MANKLPPAPRAKNNLKQVYPWDECNLQWLYSQLKRVGYEGAYEDFKRAYEDMTPIIEVYDGPYEVQPYASLTHLLETKGKFLRENITIQPSGESSSDVPYYQGQYEVTPMANVDQILRTQGTQLEDNILVEKIPYQETTNDAGGYTVIIG